MNRKLYKSNSNRRFSIESVEKITSLAFENHFHLSNFKMLILFWIKGLWTGILLSLVLHYIITH